MHWGGFCHNNLKMYGIFTEIMVLNICIARTNVTMFTLYSAHTLFFIFTNDMTDNIDLFVHTML